MSDKVPIVVDEDGGYHQATVETFAKIAQGWTPHAKAIVWLTPDEFNAVFSGRAIVATVIEHNAPMTPIIEKPLCQSLR